EPAAARPDVDVLGDRELAARAVDEVAVGIDVGRDGARVHELPARAAHPRLDRRVGRIHGEAKALGRVAREVEEAEEVDVLRPLVGLAAEGDVLALVLPRGDRGEEDGAGIGARRPAVEDDGRACRPPREALERHGAVGRAQVLAVGEEDVVARQETERGLLAGGAPESSTYQTSQPSWWKPRR